MKNKEVCKDCKYLIVRTASCDLKGTCNYCVVNGRSRSSVEEANGGYKTDSCICYVRRC